MTDRDDDIRRLEAIGTAIFGERWKAALAKAAGVGRPALMMLLSGETKRLSPSIRHALRAWVEAEQVRIFIDAQAKSQALRDAQEWLREDEP